MSKQIYPIDLFTAEDRQDFSNYVNRGLSISTNQFILDKILNDWSRNKNTIFRALGKQLRVEINITDIDQYKYERKKKIRELGINYVFFDDEHFKDFYNHYRVKTYKTNIFCINYLVFVADCYFKQGMLNWEEVKQLITLQSEDALINGQTTQNISLGLYDIKIPRGTKILRAFQKLLKRMGAPDSLMSEFERFRNQMSDISTIFKSLNNVTLVLSIHPLDIMSLSDNDCDWHSCFSWLGEGEYRNSCLEMLTSNLVLVAYLKSKKDFSIGNITIPNKSYRQMFYLHKNILLAGRGYPYQDKNLTFKILDKINELVYNNLKWKYQYTHQEYMEMKYMDENPYIFNGFSHFDSFNKHRIFFYSDGQAYNDMALNHDLVGYWCNRNKVKHTLYLNLSGKTYCLHCGVSLKQNSCDSSVPFCDDCLEEHRCDCCGNLYDDENYFSYMKHINGFYDHICNSCVEEDYLYDTFNNTSILYSTVKEIYRVKYKLSYQEIQDMIRLNPDEILDNRFIHIEQWMEEGKMCHVA